MSPREGLGCIPSGLIIWHRRPQPKSHAFKYGLLLPPAFCLLPSASCLLPPETFGIFEVQALWQPEKQPPSGAAIKI